MASTINHDTVLKEILPKWFGPILYEYNMKELRYSDIPKYSFFVFDLILNDPKAYALAIEAIGYAERTRNIGFFSLCNRRYHKMIFVAVENYMKNFPDEDFSIINTNRIPNDNFMVFTLIYLNKDRFN